jgi:uncharacterized protein (TIGR02444 family)
MNFPDSELWTFSLQTYAFPEVEKICLKLQNKYDADINIILYCLWAAEKSTRLNQGDINLLIKTTEPWQKSILRPLRDARRMMKQHIIAIPVDLREQTIKNLTEMELNAEHMSQLALEKIINFKRNTNADERSTIENASINLSAYLQQLEATSLSNTMKELSDLLNAVFQDPEAVQSTLMNEA